MKKLDELSIEEQAYVFGKPLVMNLEHVSTAISTGFGTNPAAPFNTFSHATKLANATSHFVSINNDTLYSNAQVDLSDGPVFLEIPKIEDRYYVFQLVDVWTNNFAYLGQRTLGNNGGKFMLLTSSQISQFEGEYTDYRRVISPTTIFSIVGRIALDGEKDIPNVTNIQSKLKLTELGTQLTGLPVVEGTTSLDSMDFWKKLRTYLKSFPNSKTFDSVFDSIYTLLNVDGKESNSEFFYRMTDEQIKRFNLAEKNGYSYIKESLATSVGKTQNGWQTNLHIFDYNVDYFGIGALDDKKWIITKNNALDSLKEASLARTRAAVAGLWGNHAYEAVYYPTYVDTEGNILDGENTYELYFKELPPVHAFWSITMYDAENFLLVDNEINRYSIGDRTEGLQYNEDGSLTIIVSKNKPNNSSNWLPAPAGKFRPLFRAYLPKSEILDSKYEMPGFAQL
ncbi:hypothetical protein D929_01896 [Enterococcus faecalis 02-MB-P-10]|uniref:DUF1254 domain-containing protein n=1 Tax=Enterococcus faecalis TaxID=1351 RepID=UPI000353C175|nr:DUF1254 domain-containing protein [Enterococcus faecalis]EPH72676.1 hypothetical protein D929_01896 [Enterococcus faecalis 02-MB-P-10]